MKEVRHCELFVVIANGSALHLDEARAVNAWDFATWYEFMMER
jgi:hypothetical protein